MEYIMFENPFTMWIRLATHTNQIIAASTQLIADTTNALVSPWLAPFEAQREWMLTWQERSEATAKSAQDTLTKMVKINQDLSALMLNQSIDLTRDMISLTLSPSVSHAVERHSELIKNMTHHSSKLSASTAEFA